MPHPMGPGHGSMDYLTLMDIEPLLQARI
jgi:hypothetical protein